MGIREVTYYEAWCDHADGAHHIESGDFSGWSTRDGAEVELASTDGVELPDGRAYCAAHIPDDVCLAYGTTTYVHEPADDDPTECALCGATLSAEVSTP